MSKQVRIFFSKFCGLFLEYLNFKKHHVKLKKFESLNATSERI